MAPSFNCIRHAALWIPSISLLVTIIIISVFSKGFLKLPPIFGGIIAGYITSLVYGAVSDFTHRLLKHRGWHSPNFTMPEFNINNATSSWCLLRLHLPLST
ncbi:hypothetical protein OK016_04530 [Vibrio chagasii]|nr:hypothetical protein [Vibrio chagasii]